MRYINFFRFLLMERDNKCVSWLSPHGKFYPVDKAHGKTDIGILNTLDKRDIVNGMWKRGYIRVTYQGDRLYAHIEGNRMNDKQKQCLINLAIENDFDYIYYDTGDDGSIMWSTHDQI
jgi:hypothetical protein